MEISLKKQAADAVQNVEPAEDNVSKLEDIGARLRASKSHKSNFGFKIETGADLRRTYKPADFVIDGMFQRRYLCTLTAPAGSGKTPIGQRLAAHIALGWSLCGHNVKQGKVLYLAGENPDDITMRWLGLAEKMKFDPETTPVHFIRKAFSMTEEVVTAVIQEADKTGPYTAIFIDTEAAYYPGDSESNNSERLEYARQQRRLMTISGEPCVIVLSHPVAGPKRSSKHFMESGGYVPRGGVAYLNEIDGNTYLIRPEGSDYVTLYKHRKFRGPEWAAIKFKLETFHAETVLDAEGRPTSNIMAVPVDPKTDIDLGGDTPTKEPYGTKDILKALKSLHKDGGVTAKELLYKTGIPSSTFYKALRWLVEQQRIEKNEETGRYSTPSVE